MAFLKISGVIFLPFLAMFVGSMSSENHRQFLACRLDGSSVDACLLHIHGR
jgi:hypothetical protein